MIVSASARASGYVRDHGGRVFIWFESVGETDWLRQRVSTRRAPAGMAFTKHPADGFVVFLQAGFDPPETLMLRRRPWPFGPIVVHGTGASASQWGGAGGEGGWPFGHGIGGHDGHGGAGHGGH